MRNGIVTLLLLALAAAPLESQVVSRIARPIRTGIVLTTLEAVSPGAALQGQQNFSVSLTGMGTHFSQGTTTADFGAGITLASPLSVTSPTNATAVVNVDPAAAYGYRNITVTTGTEAVTLANGFAVAYPSDYFSKSCGGATGLGTLGKGMSKTASGFLNVAGIEDWLMVSFTAGGSLTITLQGVQSPSNFDIVAYSGCGSTPIASTSSTTKSFVLPDTGPHNVILQVRPTSWDVSKPMFTVLLSGN